MLRSTALSNATLQPKGSVQRQANCKLEGGEGTQLFKGRSVCGAVVKFKGQPVAFFNGTKPAPRHGGANEADMDGSSLVTASVVGHVSKAVEHPITGTSEMEICCADAVNKEWMH